MQTTNNKQESESDIKIAHKAAAIEKKNSDSEPSFAPPEKKEIESLQHYFGKRALRPFDNSEMFRTRLSYQTERTANRRCLEIVNKDTGESIGIVPAMQLKHAWRMANSSDARKVGASALFSLSHEQWDEDCDRLVKYIRSTRDHSARYEPILFSDVFAIHEVDYQTIGLKRPNQVMALLRAAIAGEIEQNKRLIKTWKKIKRYPHRVALDVENGGIFQYEDVKKLRELNIECLNDMRNADFYKLKALLLEYDFEQIIKDINIAYKNDFAKRLDFRFKVYPVVAIIKNLVILLTLGYFFKYTLIDNFEMTLLIEILGGLTVMDAIVIFIGGERSKRRRLKVPSYIYYTHRMMKHIVRMAVVTVFCAASLVVFYNRYDGYNDIFYYRDRDDGAIAIAGLRDPDLYQEMTDGIDTTLLSHIDIPAEIDGKTVSEIDLYAFRNDMFSSLALPDSLKEIDYKAFVGCSSLEGVNIPEGVTLIGEKAFVECYSLETVALPSTLQSIGEKAFVESSIKTLSFAEGGAVEIGEYAFEECFLLSEISGMESVKRIGEGAFLYCSSLKDFSFSESLEFIGDEAFSDCSSITCISLPDTVTYIGRDAFYGCNSVKSITVPFIGTSKDKSVDQSIDDIFTFTYYYSDTSVDFTINGTAPIGSNAFNSNGWLKSVTIGDGVTEIYPGAFEGCYNLTSVQMSSSVTTIPENLFAYCNSLTTVSGFGNVTTVGDFAFTQCSSLSSIDISSANTIGQHAFSECFSLSSVDFSNSLDTLGAGAFANSALTSLTLPASLKTIPTAAFRGCKISSSLDLSHVTRIEDMAFESNYYMPSVKFSDNVEYIGHQAFYYCQGITSVEIPESVSYIGKLAFYYCNNVSNITVPFIGSSVESSSGECLRDYFSVDGYNDVSVTLTGNVTTIYTSNFEGATSVRHLIIEAPVTTIQSNAFSSSGISAITLPSTISTVSAAAFDGLYTLTSVSGENIRRVEVEAFANCTTLEKVDFPALESIGNFAFSGCVSLSDLGTLLNLKTIGDAAFYGCSSLEDISLSSSLESIGDFAFSECRYLTTLGETEGIKRIGEGAFESCHSLVISTEFSGLESIGKSAFANCYALSSIVIPSSVKTIASGAFNDSRFVSVTISEGITGIGDHAFSYMPNLSTIIIPSTVTSIGNYAFAGCTNLESVDLTLCSSVNLGKFVFEGCAYLNEVALPLDTQSIPEGLFYNCRSFNGISNLSDLNIVSIGKNAFANCLMKGAALDLGSSLVSIGESAFANTGISSISLPLSVTSIGKGAFADCLDLRSAVMPFVGSSVNTKDSSYTYVFGENTKLNSLEITLATGVTKSTFEGLDSSLRFLTLSSAVTSIGNNAFENFCDLESVVLPDTLRSIGDNAFYCCLSLKHISIPSEVNYIGSSAFYNCSLLDEIVIPASVTRIGDHTFEYCSALSDVTLHSAITSIGESAFAYCTSLFDIDLPASLNSLGSYAFYSCTSLFDISIPTGVTVINDYTFSDCQSLAIVNFDTMRVETVKPYAFYGTDLVSVKFNSYLKNIYDCAFDNIASLSEITFTSQIDKISQNAFGYNDQLAIYLPTKDLTERFGELFDGYGYTIRVKK